RAQDKNGDLQAPRIDAHRRRGLLTVMNGSKSPAHPGYYQSFTCDKGKHNASPHEEVIGPSGAYGERPHAERRNPDQTRVSTRDCAPLPEENEDNHAKAECAHAQVVA